MQQYCIGYAEIAFGIFKVDGVDLVGHGRRTDFSLLDFLLEVLHRDVLPHVAVKVYQDGVYTSHGLKERSEIVVV